MRNILVIMMTFVCILSMILLTSFRTEVMDLNNWSNIEQTEEISNESRLIEEINIETGVGDIELIGTNGDSIKIYVTKRVGGKNGKEAELNKKSLIDEVEVLVFEKDNKLNIMPQTKSNRDGNLWKWQARKYKDLDLEVEFIVEIPNSISKFYVRSDLGSININDLNGSFDIKNEVGNITLQDAILNNKSRIVTGVGRVDINIKNMINSKETYIETGVGDVNIELPKGTEYVIDIKGSKQASKSGIPILILRPGVGEVKINE